MMASQCQRWFLMAAALLLASTSIAMSSTATGSRDLSFREGPYWVTITIPESRDTFRNRVISESGRFQFPGRRLIADIAFTPPGGGPPYTAVALYVYDRYKGNDESVTSPLNPTLQEFVVAYNARNARFHPSLDFPQLQAGNVSTLRLGHRNWFKFNKWNLEAGSFQYVTMIDDEKMLVLDWLPPRDTFFKRKRAAKKRPDIESMLASISISIQPTEPTDRVISARLSALISAVRAETDASKQELAAREIPKLLNEAELGNVNDATLLDLASLLDTSNKEVRRLVAFSLSMFESRAHFVVPRLLSILRSTECLAKPTSADADTVSTMKLAFKNIMGSDPLPTVCLVKLRPENGDA